MFKHYLYIICTCTLKFFSFILWAFMHCTCSTKVVWNKTPVIDVTLSSLTADGVRRRVIKVIRRKPGDGGSCKAVCNQECDSHWSTIYADLCFCSPCPDYGSMRYGNFQNPHNETCDAVCTRNNCYDETEFIKFWDGSCYCNGCPDPRGTPPEDHFSCKKLPRVLVCRNATDIDCSKYRPGFSPCPNSYYIG